MPTSDGLPYHYKEHVRLLVSASPNWPANCVFLSQQTSTSQPKPAQNLTSEQAENREKMKEEQSLSVCYSTDSSVLALLTGVRRVARLDARTSM